MGLGAAAMEPWRVEDTGICDESTHRLDAVLFPQMVVKHIVIPERFPTKLVFFCSNSDLLNRSKW